MSNPIDKLKPVGQYPTHISHLNAIIDALVANGLTPTLADKVVQAAYEVGRRTTTTDDWCDF